MPYSSTAEFIEAIAARVYELAKQQGGSIPYTAIRELSENFIHAGFAEPVVSVLDDGATIRFSDQGPGISDAEKALQPGFTTATSEMKEVIRGVGSGLPLVRDFLSTTGGNILIEQNLGRGCVVTITERCSPRSDEQPYSPVMAEPTVPSGIDSLFAPPQSYAEDSASAKPILTNRQKQVLALVLENGSAGPSVVSRELTIGLSTAYRDLASLEEAGLIISDAGKRTLTPEGIAYLTSVLSSR